MNTEIKTGDKILIKENLLDELVRCGFNRAVMSDFAKEFTGKECIAYDVYQGENADGSFETYVTVALCCEIPLTACKLLKQ